MKRNVVLLVAVVIVFTITACDQVSEDVPYDNTIYMEIDLLSAVNTYGVSQMENSLFGYPEWINDDFLLYSKAKLYRSSLNSTFFQQLLPDSLDCFGYGISYSTAQQKIWFSNTYGIWSCNFTGGDITHINPTPIKEMQLSNNGNFLMGFRVDRSESLCLVDLSTGIMEEQITSYGVYKAFYNEDLQKISYLCWVQEIGRGQVRVRNRDGSGDQMVVESGLYLLRNFQVSANGRYVAGTAMDNGGAGYPLFVHDLLIGETVQLDSVRSFQMCPQSNRMILLPVDGSYFKVSSFAFDTGQMTEIHSGYMGDCRYYYLYKMILRADEGKLRIYGWGRNEQIYGRIM
ncbi:MAG: hypothetical protein CVU48_03075 [Candidatus Cloacimonetes bacterium HGW-Cloacimonetes-1]|jgi:hypothetical protein|nr:MAG: hypothetical protein CVU48_03075 [Candidatus Cloacimonetes bacterium HGW-Cloacimonetes-1]